MIEFRCTNCNQKITVQEQHAGKQAKCRKCGNINIVPGSAGQIKFSCESCGQSISLAKVYAGKKARCPNCKNTVVIPRLPQQGIAASRSNTDGTKRSPAAVPGIRLQNDGRNQSASRAEDMQRLTEISAQNRTEPAAERKLPWIIDVFLYPISVPGLTILGIFLFTPLIISLIGFCLRALGLGIFAIPLGFISLIIHGIITLYMFWYLGECIRESAFGELRAPETLNKDEGFGEMFLQMLHIFGCMVLCLGPAMAYYGLIEKRDSTLWTLLACGGFFLPMVLLATVMFDSFYGLNPIVITGSIFRTFFPYCGLVLASYAVVAIIVVMWIYLPVDAGNQVGHFILRAASIYLLWVAGHLLGRFYYRNEEKLYWEV